MINELHELAFSLERCGIETKEWNNSLKPIPNPSNPFKTYHIFIGEDSNIDSIDILDPKLAQCLRKYEPGGNGHSFPGLNIEPIHLVTDNESVKTLNRYKRKGKKLDANIINDLCINGKDNWATQEKKLLKCLFGVSKELKSKIGDKSKTLSTLIDRIERFSYDQLKIALRGYILNAIESGEEVKSLLPILVSTKNNTIPIFLDVYDCEDLMASVSTIELLNNTLNKIDEYKPNKECISDAFNPEFTSCKEKLPSVTLPHIGKVIMRSAHKDSECLTRYGKIESDSFPIGYHTISKVKRAFEWIISEEKRGKTWGAIKEGELIVAYLNDFPKVSDKLASCFGTRDVDDAEVRFVEVTESVIKSLRGYDIPDNASICIFSLKKIDKGRTKVSFSRNYTVGGLEKATFRWMEGCRNIPDKYLDNNDNKIPFPTHIIEYINCIWKMDGETECRSMINETKGIELFFDELSPPDVQRLLSTFIRNYTNLFFFVSSILIKKAKLKYNVYKHYKYTPFISGLLLYKLGISKEVYMKGTPFIIGHLTGISDYIHQIYCFISHLKRNKKGKRYPARFIGNNLMLSILDNPNRGFSRLTERVSYYYGWIQVNCTSENTISYIEYYKDTVRELVESEVLIPTRFSDIERTIFMSGYYSACRFKFDKHLSTHNSD
jgi:hypothetical protein